MTHKGWCVVKHQTNKLLMFFSGSILAAAILQQHINWVYLFMQVSQMIEAA